MNKTEITCDICGQPYCPHACMTRHFYKDGKWYWQCYDCEEIGEGLNVPTYYVPMYEGKIVDPNTHEWGGFECCKKCSDNSIPEVEQGVLTDWQGKVLDFDHLPENP